MRSVSATSAGNDSIDLMKFAHGDGNFSEPQSRRGRWQFGIQNILMKNPHATGTRLANTSALQ
ncbi:hypothetical protein C9417_16725 [Rhizobium sp. SEMIA 4088]|nr:hypothetical protein C9417_16725 [Rhizobium sp. SEMIA 4088]